MNKGPDHLSRLEHGEEPTSLDDTLPDAQLLAIRKVDDQFAEIVQFLSTGMAPREYSVIWKINISYVYCIRVASSLRNNIYIYIMRRSRR